MVKKYAYICFLLIAFFFLYVNQVDAAIDSCVCHANGNNPLGLKEFTVYNNNNISFNSNLTDIYNILGFLDTDFVPGTTAHSTIHTSDVISSFMQDQSTCPKSLYIVEGNLNNQAGYFISSSKVFPNAWDILIFKTVNYKFTCTVPSSEEDNYRNGILFNDLYDALLSSKNAYESCLKTSCSNLTNLKNEFENHLSVLGFMVICKLMSEYILICLNN